LALRIPKPFAEEARIEPNSPVNIALFDGKIIITTIPEPNLSLKELIEKVNKVNLHS
jgi:antitoxin MazE